ncbi:hypothetical protein DICVIV_08236 [Dictyocaulus viviparus]|uniref:Uncharacterized protein n=1 Tax=Dictyocaulus viviparus TaxID=29172 RepID=A0A0D8XPM1_DICVI|nr:hypothetical protein DICVIV_08236 [Dictyocaulus viviparus]
MGDSSPEPLDELDEPRCRRVVRWQSVRIVCGEHNGSPAFRGLRRTGTVPAMRSSAKGLKNRNDVFDGQHSYLRVPSHSGRTSPSIASNTSEPESCIDDVHYQDDDDIDIGECLFIDYCNCKISFISLRYEDTTFTLKNIQ